WAWPSWSCPGGVAATGGRVPAATGAAGSAQPVATTRKPTPQQATARRSRPIRTAPEGVAAVRRSAAAWKTVFIAWSSRESWASCTPWGSG
ncbi:MAG: hypothetical protein EBX36_12360, partial [Planctomycetia bacterium]|nr:hypothetical protein [Planctomycetia bacterium]